MNPPFAFPVPSQPRVGLLIDAENARAAQMPQVMTCAKALGRITQRRAYGEWTGPQLQPWRKVLEAHAIRPCQQFRHARNKNASDIALIMDAMELLHQRAVDVFCIVSSDCDYAGVAGRIREAGLSVYGFGQPGTLPAFVAACDGFLFLDEADAKEAVETRSDNAPSHPQTGWPPSP